MRILISNDDGINAEGIHVLTEELSKNHEVYVAAPATQMSAASHKISIHEKLYVEERTVAGAKKAWAISGTPADCTKLGLLLCENEGIDIDVVYSGINHGGNYGYDAIYSGTIGAAMEANISYKPAVAVSVNSHEPVNGFGYAANLASKVASQLEEELSKLRAASPAGTPGTCGANKNVSAGTPSTCDACTSSAIAEVLTAKPRTISINVPDIPAAEVKGVKMATLGPRDYDNLFHLHEDEKGIYYDYKGTPRVYKEGDLYEGKPISEDADVILMQKGYATISILGVDLTDYDLTNRWELCK